MPDVVSPEVRSRMMAGIRGKDTKPELLLRKALHRDGFRYRLHARNLPGRPDMVFPRYKAAVFVHGCFWHGHEGCSYFKVPATRREFWEAKLQGNRERDALRRKELDDAGWRTAVIWECATRHQLNDTVTSIEQWLVGEQRTLDVAWQ
ncbi:T/G mismatch-specific endonuclease [Nocardioides sp. J9]|uniref:very short patch repair endonuclease n=1 Tax=Nocardioides sp. J9 TaxID=935844 RepID=UPI0011A1D6D5|nr:very short patch repair endonuclease [Nocardioides sp. J9]TWG93048.1 T/G mismatch-specific endonuclease [Nocardioides sp. J9]